MGAYAIPNFLFQKWLQQRQYCIEVERLVEYVERLEAHRKRLLYHFDRAPGQIRGQKLGMRKPNASHVQQDNDAANLTAWITDCILQCQHIAAEHLLDGTFVWIAMFCSGIDASIVNFLLRIFTRKVCGSMNLRTRNM